MTTNNLKITDAIHFKEKGQASNLWRVSEEIGSLPWGRNLTVQDWTKAGQGSIKLVKEKTSLLETLGKVILMATVVIPLFALICKAYFRSKYKFEVVESASAPSFEALKNQNQAEEKTAKPPLREITMVQVPTLLTKKRLTKELEFSVDIHDKFIDIISLLLEDVEGKRFFVVPIATDRFEEFLDAEKRMQLAACDALVVLRWGVNVAPGTTKYIDASGMVKKQIPIIQIQYSDDQAKIISQPML